MEENKQYSIYTESIRDLAGSLVIKSDASAKGVNDMTYALALAPFDEYDPTTWKYYQNICGIYYPSDEPMYVTSIDTLEQILFSKETLVHHRATARAYLFGTTYYKELVHRYPNQEQLIRGILYPADMDEAINADDGKILAYPTYLVEETEPSLIPMIQNWIYGFMTRWNNIQYSNIDNLYNTAMYGVMFSQLPGAIENMRLSLSRTNEAHTYHITQYLSSNSKLGQYIPYMTRSLMMYFYRNIKYIQVHAGSDETLDELIQKCMTERNIPIAHFDLRHSTEKMPEQLTPLAIFHKTPINTEANIDHKDNYTASELYTLQEAVAPGNSKYKTELLEGVTNQSRNSEHPNSPTKLLQSTVVDYTDSEKFRMADILLNHWLWLSAIGKYNAVVTFTIPVSGITLSLSASDAFVFFTYAFVRGGGFDIVKLPVVTANKVQRQTRVSKELLTEVLPAEMYSDPRLDYLVSSITPPYSIISIEAFRAQCQHLFEEANTQWLLCCEEESMSTRGYLEAACARLWVDANIDLAEYPNQEFADWFESRNIVIKDYTDAQLLEIAGIILAEATGANLSTNIALKDIQTAMCNIILGLSSYSIQLDKNINLGPVIDAGSVQVRIDEQSIVQEASDIGHMEISRIEALSVKSYMHSRLDIDVNGGNITSVKDSKISNEVVVDVPKVVIDGGSNLKHVVRHIVPIGAITTVVSKPMPSNPLGHKEVPGMEQFLTLSKEEQQSKMLNAWDR